MIGVTTYPYKVNERLYQEDFTGVVANRLTHPYLSTFSPAGSLPFNVLSNSAASAPSSHWVSESKLAFTPKTPQRSSPASGVRTEQTTA